MKRIKGWKYLTKFHVFELNFWRIQVKTTLSYHGKSRHQTAFQLLYEGSRHQNNTKLPWKIQVPNCVSTSQLMFEPSVASSDPRTDFYQSSFLLISLDELGRRAQYYSANCDGISIIKDRTTWINVSSELKRNHHVLVKLIHWWRVLDLEQL